MSVCVCVHMHSYVYEIACIQMCMYVGMWVWIYDFWKYVYKVLNLLLQLVTNQVSLLLPTRNNKRESKIG